jgi:hypothetical protein
LQKFNLEFDKAAGDCDLFSMRRLFSFMAVVLVTIWLPATLRCELELVPGLEAMGCPTPCSDATGKNCTDGCVVLEGGLFKVAHDVKVAAPLATDLCEGLACCLCSALRVPELAPAYLVRSGGAEDARQRTWQFVRRAAPPSRAPAV